MYGGSHFPLFGAAVFAVVGVGFAIVPFVAAGSAAVFGSGGSGAPAKGVNTVTGAELAIGSGAAAALGSAERRVIANATEAKSRIAAAASSVRDRRGATAVTTALSSATTGAAARVSSLGSGLAEIFARSTTATAVATRT